MKSINLLILLSTAIVALNTDVSAMKRARVNDRIEYEPECKQVKKNSLKELNEMRRYFVIKNRNGRLSNKSDWIRLLCIENEMNPICQEIDTRSVTGTCTPDELAIMNEFYYRGDSEDSEDCEVKTLSSQFINMNIETHK